MKIVSVIAFLVLSMFLVAPAFAYTGSADFPELFKYSAQKNANLETALQSISYSFNEKDVSITQELLAAIMATLVEEVEVHNFLPREEIGDYGMGSGSTYTVKGSRRSTPYEGGVDYKGRGYIQLTLKSNYEKYCPDCVGESDENSDICGCKNQEYCTVTDASICPQVKALQPDYAAKIFALYYATNKLVSLSNSKNYWDVGKIINGGNAYASDFGIKANEYLTMFSDNPDKTQKLLTWLDSGTPASTPVAVDVLSIGTTSSSTAQAPSVGWNRTFGGAGEDMAYSVHQTSDGGYIFAGITSSFGTGGSDAWLIKTDSNGRELWSRTFGGTNSDQAESIHLTSDGGYILAGSTASFSSGGGGTNPYGTDPYAVNSDVWLIKTDSKGNMIWSKTFGGLNVDLAHSVLPTPDGGYIIAGETQSLSYWGKNALQALKQMQAEGSSWPTPIRIHPWDGRRFIDSDAWLIKTDANGNELWNRTFGQDTEAWCTGCADDSANSIQLTSDGGYILACDALGGTPWIIKVNANGDQIWNKTFAEMGYDYHYANSVQPTPDGGYILAGGKYSTNAWLIKTDANGNKLWNKTLDNSSALSAQCSSDGGYILAGSRLIKVDANGNEIWDKSFGSANSWANSVQPTSDGGYILAGVTLSHNNEKWWDAWLIKTDTNGESDI